MDLNFYYEMITDIWRLLKKYHRPVDQDQYWLNLTDEVNAFCEKYNKNEFACEMVFGMMSELERVFLSKRAMA